MNQLPIPLRSCVYCCCPTYNLFFDVDSDCPLEIAVKTLQRHNYRYTGSG